MRLVLLVLVLILGYSQYSEAQRGRRGRRNGRKTPQLEILKNICCYFVNDNSYTLASKYRYREDATVLTQRFLQEHGDTLTLDSIARSQEELVVHLYNILTDIRLGDYPSVQVFHNLGIHVNQSYGDVQTNLEWLGDTRRAGMGTLIYTIRYQGAVKSWAVYTGSCPGEGYEVTPLKDDPIPLIILGRQQQIGAAELKASK